MLPVLINDLEIIEKSSQFDQKTQNLADKLVSQIKGNFFLVILHFILDVLQHLSFWSVQMQESTALLVDFSGFVEKILASLENLKKTTEKN